MTITQKLSSQSGARTSAANKAVAARCLAEPILLAEIAASLTTREAALLGDCAEVMTLTAQEKPELVAPYAESLTPLLSHKTTRVRWEATHALALIAHLRSDAISGILSQLARAMESDLSIIVRDYTIDIIGNYAQAGPEQARWAYPLLKRSAAVWAGRHVGHTLTGLRYVAAQAPELQREILTLARAYVDDKRGVVRKAARALVKALEEL